jgi:poly(A) polymerase
MPIREKIDAVVRDVVGELAEHGHEALIVGGAVRDLLLGIAPKDYDLATSAHPEEVKRIFGRRARIIGRRFRLVHVFTGDRDYLEVSTFRREPTAEERRGRETDDGVMLWRDNAYGSLEEDAVRRDFTVNALYFDPIGTRGIIDFCGGLEDLDRRRVKSIGDPDTKLSEDPVRILRALKLAGQYGFELEPGLDRCVREMSPSICLSSRARLFEELLKILLRQYSEPTFAVCRRYGLLEHLLPGLALAWSRPEGALLRSVLTERDARVAAGGYSQSKTLAIATLMFPVVQAVFRDGTDDPQQPFWAPSPGMEKACRELISDFFAPIPVPRFLTARARDLLMLLPRLHEQSHPTRVRRHPEYKYGRELFLLLGAVHGWDRETLEFWPPADEPAHDSHHRRRAPRGRRRGRRSRSKDRNRRSE